MFILNALIIFNLFEFLSLAYCRHIITITHNPLTIYVPNQLFPPIPNNTQTSSSSSSSSSSSVISTANNENDDPEQTPGLYQGDIAIDSKSHQLWKVGLNWDTYPDKKWPNATVTYLISDLYEPSDKLIIQQAIKQLTFLSCIKFLPYNDNENDDDDFLLIWPVKYPQGCWSYVGRIGGPQIVSLQPPNKNGPNCLGTPGRALHELMHALGIFHEQSRADRDRFVNVHWDNIISDFKNNFEKQSLTDTTYNFEYDYQSIMHYGTKYFSKSSNQTTLTPKIPPAMEKTKLGQRRGLSVTDCLKINDLYDCMSNVKQRRKYYTLCRLFGVN